MQIAIDVKIWGDERGYGRQERALLTMLVFLDRSNSYTLFVDSPDYLPALPLDVINGLVKSSQSASQATYTTGHHSLGVLWKMSQPSLPDNLLLYCFQRSTAMSW